LGTKGETGLGVEIVPQVIEDARENAVSNHIEKMGEILRYASNDWKVETVCLLSRKAQ